MCGLEPKNQTVRVKHIEADGETPTNFNGIRNSSLLLVANGYMRSCLLVLWLLYSSYPRGLLCSPAVHSQQHQVQDQSTHHKVVSCLHQSLCSSVQKYMLANVI